MHFVVTPSGSKAGPQQLKDILAEPGFGRHFTDHMVTVHWTESKGWFDAQLSPYGPLTLDPATRVFHYGQSVFEGFKAYRQSDRSIATFRPGANAKRFQHSASRLALPKLPVEDFVAAADVLVRADSAWVPDDEGTSLYLRPFMMATEVGLGIGAMGAVTFMVIASPAGSYFSGGSKPISIWLSERYIRAAPGGTGDAKFAGNYAASLVAQKEAASRGCDQVVFLDAVERRWIEELGGMNLFFVFSDGTISTPALTGTILEGVTRDTICTIARDLGYEVAERRIGIDEWLTGVETGRIQEVFACGTAAVISSIGTLCWSDGEVVLPDATPVASAIRQKLVALQHGRAPDQYGWLHHVV